MAQHTIKGILSFPAVFAPEKATPTSDPRFGLNLLVHESDPQHAAMQADIKEMLANAYPAGTPPGTEVSYSPCENVKSYFGKPQYAGWWVLRAYSRQDSPPIVCDMRTQPVMDRGKIFPGAEAYVQFNFYAYSGGKGGIAAGLNGVMSDGVTGSIGRLDNKQSASQMFAGVVPAAPASTAPSAPAAAATPPPVPLAFN
tara:strand:+ start:2866 stop:3459 length:594 start_codon:yes stop_codon:yes gene_type:complete